MFTCEDEYYEAVHDGTLDNCYAISNQEQGHAYNCAWAAGGDCTCGYFNVAAGHARSCSYADPDRPGNCTCGKVTFPVFAVTVDLSGDRYAVDYAGKFEQASAIAKRYATKGWPKVRLLRVNSTEELDAVEDQIERVRDWESD